MDKFKETVGENRVEETERRIDKLARTKFNGDLKMALEFACRNYTPAPLSKVFEELKGHEVQLAHDVLVNEFNERYPGGWEAMRAENYLASHYSIPRYEIKQMKKNPEKSKTLRDMFILLTANAGMVLAGVLGRGNPGVTGGLMAVLGTVDTFAVGSFAKRLMTTFKLDKLKKLYNSKEYKRQLENIPEEDINRLDVLAETIHTIEMKHGTAGVVERGRL